MILFWTRNYPSNKSGSAKVILEYVKNLDKKNYYFVCEKKTNDKIFKINNIKFINSFKFDKFGRLGVLIKFFSIFIYIFLGIYIIRRFKIKKIFTVYNDIFWVFSSILISKLTSTELIFNIHDPLKNKSKFAGLMSKYLINIFEPFIFKNFKIIVLYESLKKYYERLYKNTNITVINHIFVNKKKLLKKNYKENKINVFFIGNVYDYNCIRLKKFIKFVNTRNNFVFHIISQTSKKKIYSKGIRFSNKVKFYYSLSQKKIDYFLQSANLLYLPLNSGSKIPLENVKYVIPTKFLDYLNANRYILLDMDKSYYLSKISRNISHIMNIEDFIRLKNFDILKENKTNFINKNNKILINKFFDKKKNISKLKNFLEITNE
jgi:hypothetical protein